MHKAFRDLKFKRYVFAKKVLRTICQNLTREAGQNTLVGFGDWSNQDSAGIIKKSPAGPVKRLENELRRHCRVVSVDEHLTSKLHSCCHHRMRQMYQKRVCRDGVVRSVKVHSVLHCDNNGCHGMTVNRDVNASRNIPTHPEGDSRRRASPRGVPSVENKVFGGTRHERAASEWPVTLALLPVPCVSVGFRTEVAKSGTVCHSLATRVGQPRSGAQVLVLRTKTNLVSFADQVATLWALGVITHRSQVHHLESMLACSTW